MQRVLFACVHNAGRSQMAAALFNAFADPTKAAALSAGTAPAAHVHPEVLVVLQELGLDLSQAQPQRLTTDLAAGAAWLITMGCHENCPVVPGVRRADWPLADPKGRSLDEVRVIRDDIARRVRAFLAEQRWLPERNERTDST